MASPSIRELEARIDADRQALKHNRHLLQVAVERTMSSPKGLLGGFAAGLASGWVLKGPTRDKQVRRLERDLEKERARSGGKQGGGRMDSLLSLLPMVTMGLRIASMLRNPAPSEGAAPEDFASGAGP